MTRAMTSRSTSFFFLRAVSRSAAAATRSRSRIAHRAERGLVKQHGGVGGEDLAGATGALHPKPQVLGRILRSEGTDFEAVMQSRVKRTIVA